MLHTSSMLLITKTELITHLQLKGSEGKPVVFCQYNIPNIDFDVRCQ